jgi:hypothetical protein
MPNKLLSIKFKIKKNLPPEIKDMTEYYVLLTILPEIKFNFELLEKIEKELGQELGLSISIVGVIKLY